MVGAAEVGDLATLPKLLRVAMLLPVVTVISPVVGIVCRGAVSSNADPPLPASALSAVERQQKDGGGSMRAHGVVAWILASVLATGCVVYEPVPVSYGSSFDRAWSAALGALQDSGVQVSSADTARGLIRGTKDGIDVSVSVVRQADASTRVQFDAKGSERDPGLGSRFSQAYDRRMGR